MCLFRAGKQKLSANVVLAKEKVHVIYTVYLLLLRIKSVLPTTVTLLFLKKIKEPTIILLIC